MIIKKFVGKTEEEAVEAAKKELGSGLVVMNVKNVKKRGLAAIFSSKQVEVTVALEEEKDTLSSPRREQPVSTVKVASESSQNIEKKLDSLQTLLVNKFSQEESNQRTKTVEEEPVKPEPEEKKEKAEETVEGAEQEKFVRLLYNTMLDSEVDEKYANQIIDDAEKNRKPNVPLDYILGNVYQKMILKFGKAEGILPAAQGVKIILFMGPTGVGKTTTIAKLASSYVMNEKKKVALLTADTYRIAAAEQLRTYANILEIPFRVIYSEQEAETAIRDFADYDYIFVDTAGHSHKNEEQMEAMKKFLEAVEHTAECQTFLVLSATTKYRDLLKIATNYKAIADYQLIFTKLDETATLGNLLNLKLFTGADIAYVTCGQNVPDDIERFDPQKTVKLLLSTKH